MGGIRILTNSLKYKENLLHSCNKEMYEPGFERRFSTFKIIGFNICLILLIMTSSCSLIPQKKDVSTLQKQNDSLLQIVENRDSLMNEVMVAFYEIEQNLEYIKKKGNIISSASDNPDIEESRKDRIIDDVKNLAEMLQENNKKLIALNKKLKNSGIKINKLESKIADLSDTILHRNDAIVNLTAELDKKNFEVSILSEQIANLEVELEKNNTVIKNQQQSIKNFNKAWYAVGTKKELQQNGLIEKKGGLLGIGKTKIVNRDLSLNYFSEIDIRDTKSIQLNASKVNLISEHPTESYEFVTKDEQISFLAINDINEFYKFSKYVVLEVKRNN